jgi:hypothetical protein
MTSAPRARPSDVNQISTGPPNTASRWKKAVMATARKAAAAPVSPTEKAADVQEHLDVRRRVGGELPSFPISSHRRREGTMTEAALVPDL